MVLLLWVVGGCGLGWGADPEVAVIGDSITQQSADEIRAALSGSYEVEVKAQAGKTIEEMSPFVRRAVESGPDAVIINLGTNDTNGGTDFERDLKVVIDLLSDVPCVIMVTVNDFSGLQPAQKVIADRINEMIEESGYAVWDWNAEVKDQPGWITGDAIHPSDTGRVAIADAYRTMLDDCDL